MGLITKMALFLTTAPPQVSEDQGWELGTFFKNAADAMKTWGHYFLIALGVIMIIAAGYQIFKGLVNPQRSQVNWVMTIFLLIIGGAFTFGGYALLARYAAGGKKTLETMGTGSTSGGMIVPAVNFFKYGLWKGL